MKPIYFLSVSIHNPPNKKGYLEFHPREFWDERDATKRLKQAKMREEFRRFREDIP